MADMIHPVKKQNMYLVAVGLFLISVLLEFISLAIQMTRSYKNYSSGTSSNSSFAVLIIFLLGSLATGFIAYCTVLLYQSKTPGKILKASMAFTVLISFFAKLLTAFIGNYEFFKAVYWRSTSNSGGLIIFIFIALSICTVWALFSLLLYGKNTSIGINICSAFYLFLYVYMFFNIVEFNFVYFIFQIPAVAAFCSAMIIFARVYTRSGH